MVDKLPSAPLRLDDNIAVWAEFEELGKHFKTQSLGQGAPGFPPPKFLRDNMMDAIDNGHNQYCRTFGSLALNQAIADIYGPKLNQKLDPLSNILVTAGANGALSSFIQALINPGDEFVCFEPCFPMYLDHLQISGGVLKTVPLEVDSAKDWAFDPELFRKSLSSKTRLLLLNNPHNPTGKCFSRHELETITEILQDFPDCMVLCDEVYDFLTFDGKEHVRFATIADNWKKCVTVYSGGKLFNATGWKIGWAIAPPKLLKLGGILNNTTFYCINHPGQIAIANSLPLAQGEFISNAQKQFTEVRDYLTKEVSEMDLPWEPLPSQSGYFMMADIRKC